MILDHEGIAPTPAREVREQIEPPEADATEAVLITDAPRYRLPPLLHDATGMRR